MAWTRGTRSLPLLTEEFETVFGLPQLTAALETAGPESGSPRKRAGRRAVGHAQPPGPFPPRSLARSGTPGDGPHLPGPAQEVAECPVVVVPSLAG